MPTFSFTEPIISQGELVTFANDQVNLKRDDAADVRAKVNRLRDHLDRYISEHPEIGMVKSMLSGSLAKGTALSTFTDVDVALYLSGSTAPQELTPLISWLVERLKVTFPNTKIYGDGPCVVVEYVDTPKVEITPILYFGGKDYRGFLWDRDTGTKVETSIPLHLDFIRKRKLKSKTHFRQVIRFMKWWAQNAAGFTPRSFAVELMTARLFDSGCDFSDYHAAIEAFFVYIQKSGLKERIAFTDNYAASALPAARSSIVEIFDPVNPKNNVTSKISESQRVQLVQAAETALDDLSYARNCQTKAEALECWRAVMGPSFTA